MAPSLEVESILDVAGLSKERISVVEDNNAALKIVRNGPLPSTVKVPSGISTKLELEDHPIDIKPHLKVGVVLRCQIVELTPLAQVAVVGAGLSGITAGILLPAKVPGIDLTIFDKNADVEGTWY